MRNLSAKGRYISNKIGKAIADYNLIEDNDRILVAVSGGKDSLTLLKLLSERQRWAPVRFELFAAHVITDHRCAGCVHKDRLTKVFDDLSCPYRFLDVRLKNGKEKKVSCFWCAWNRRKALFNLADELGFNKIALGHHKDDFVETILLNLFYNGEISSMNAGQPLFKGKITLIRPLVYVEEETIKAYAQESGFHQQVCRCPNAKTSKRALMKKLIPQLEKDPKLVKSNIFMAPSRIRDEYLGTPKSLLRK
ncbi:MAG: ATP-binding protein [Candidatus Omnitrophota bacterium]